MVELNKKQKLEHMLDYASEKAIADGFTFTRKYDNVYIKNKDGKNSGIIFLNYQMPEKELRKLYAELSREQTNNFVLFYKDYETFFKRVVDSNSSWRSEKSLKKYTEQEINNIISLTIQERNALFGFSDHLLKTNVNPRNLEGKKLFYFQPETPRLEKGNRVFGVRGVYLDYNHELKDPNAKRFAHDHYSKTYFFLDDLTRS